MPLLIIFTAVNGTLRSSNLATFHLADIVVSYCIPEPSLSLKQPMQLNHVYLLKHQWNLSLSSVGCGRSLH